MINYFRLIINTRYNESEYKYIWFNIFKLTVMFTAWTYRIGRDENGRLDGRVTDLKNKL